PARRLTVTRRRARARAGGGLRPGVPAPGLRPPGHPAAADPEEPRALRHRGDAGLSGGARPRRGSRSGAGWASGHQILNAGARMASGPQLIDWHTHCFLPEHLSTEARDTMRARGVIGGEAGPDDHRRGVADGGAERFLVIKMPTAWGRTIPN